MRLGTVLALIFVIIVASIIIINVPLVESILAVSSTNRGEFQNAIVILPILFVVVAYIFSNRK